jgi:hypothetical protein
MGSFGLSLLLSSLLTHGAVSCLYPTVETNYKRKYDHIFPPYSCRRVIAVHGEKKKGEEIESRGKKQICVYNNEWVQAVVVVWIGGVVLL